MDILNNLYKKIHGSYFGFLGVGISITSIFIAYLLYIQVDASFTIFTHFISDLGDGANYSNIVFNIGMICTSIINLLFYIYLTQYLMNQNAQKGPIFASFGSVLLSFVGGLFVGFFPSATAHIPHLIGALFSFAGSFLISVFYSISEFSVPNFNRKIASSGLVQAPFPIIFMLLYITLYFSGINTILPIFMEWTAYFSQVAWLLIQAGYLFKISK
jgi:hypothetical membrane protein